MCRIASEWYGDDQNGVEVRKNDDGTPDEILLYVGGKAVAILEQMDHGQWWGGLYAPGCDTVHLDFAAFGGEIKTLVEER